jgi:hypothetical protein
MCTRIKIKFVETFFSYTFKILQHPVLGHIRGHFFLTGQSVMSLPNLKGIQAVRIEFFLTLKVANIRCFILIAVEIFHNIIHK